MMEILVIIVIIILARIFVNLYIRVPAMLFYDSSIPLIIAFFSLFCLFPIGRHKLYIERERKYRWADIKSEVNPLYVAGFFRKSTSDKNILSNLKGKFYISEPKRSICSITKSIVYLIKNEINLRPIIGGALVVESVIGLVALTADDVLGIGALDDVALVPLSDWLKRGLIMIFG